MVQDSAENLEFPHVQFLDNVVVPVKMQDRGLVQTAQKTAEIPHASSHEIDVPVLCRLGLWSRQCRNLLSLDKVVVKLVVV